MDTQTQNATCHACRATITRGASPCPECGIKLVWAPQAMHYTVEVTWGSAFKIAIAISAVLFVVAVIGGLLFGSF